MIRKPSELERLLKAGWKLRLNMNPVRVGGQQYYLKLGESEVLEVSPVPVTALMDQGKLVEGKRVGNVVHLEMAS
jgi:hypothetical protein